MRRHARRFQRSLDGLGQGGDEGGLHAHGGRAQIGGATDLLGKLAILVVQFDQGLDVLGNEGDRHDHSADAVPPDGLPRLPFSYCTSCVKGGRFSDE